eukprot:TRINITY_DN12159_c0_g1_i1.p1 TRINITY_DN12159_c0_g1~~TRINITY_DN12159_c0_g1_i1.p1  ORF type:complete len:676 (-),score=117.90 TRINITY_DN12159_c0_g1_i1:85-2112(-)
MLLDAAPLPAQGSRRAMPPSEKLADDCMDFPSRSPLPLNGSLSRAPPTRKSKPDALRALQTDLVRLQAAFVEAHEKEVAELWSLLDGNTFEEQPPPPAPFYPSEDSQKFTPLPFLDNPPAELQLQTPRLKEAVASALLAPAPAPAKCLNGSTDALVDEKLERQTSGEQQSLHSKHTEIETVMETCLQADAPQKDEPPSPTAKAPKERKSLALQTVDSLRLTMKTWALPTFISTTTTVKPQVGDLEDQYYKQVDKEIYASAVGPEDSIAKRHKRPSYLRRLTEHFGFDLFFGTLIVANAILMAAEVDLIARGHSPSATFVSVSDAFTFVFVCELGIRIFAAGPWRYFCNATDAWNYFDFFIVSVSLMDFVINKASLDSPGGGVENIRMIRMLRITRSIKVFRAVRLVRFVRALRTLLNSLMGTLKQVMWSFVLMLALDFLFGVIIAQAVSEHRLQEYPDYEEEVLPGQLGEYWGSVARCMYTLFKAISQGINWEDVTPELNEVGYVWTGVFLLYIAFIQYVVLNVVIGVFCESAAEAARQDIDLAVQLHREQRAAYCDKIKSLFQDIDGDGSNCITFLEMQEHLQQDEAKALFRTLDLNIEDIWELFKLLDTDHTSQIELDEFINGCFRLRGTASAMDIAKLSYDNKVFRKRVFNFMHDVENKLGMRHEGSESSAN